MLKKTSIIIMSVVLSLCAVSNAKQGYVIYGTYMPSPESKETYNYAGGFEAQIRNYFKEQQDLYWGFSAGVLGWKGKAYHEDASGQGYRMWLESKGNVTSVPVGFSLGLDKSLGDTSLVVDAGLKYHIVNSNYKLQWWGTYGSHTERITIDNTVTFDLGIHVEKILFSDDKYDTKLLLGVAYVADLMDNKPQLAGTEIDIDANLTGFTFRLGVLAKTK